MRRSTSSGRGDLLGGSLAGVIASAAGVLGDSTGEGAFDSCAVADVAPSVSAEAVSTRRCA